MNIKFVSKPDTEDTQRVTLLIDNKIKYFAKINKNGLYTHAVVKWTAPINPLQPHEEQPPIKVDKDFMVPILKFIRENNYLDFSNLDRSNYNDEVRQWYNEAGITI